MALGMTKTWTAKEIDSAVEGAVWKACCPYCPSMMSPLLGAIPRVTKIVGPWTLSVGRDDVMVTVPSACSVSGHPFIVVVSLWRRAQTPFKGPKIKAKLAPKIPQRRRPLLNI